MKRPYVKLFRIQANLDKLFRLYCQGLSMSEMSRRFGCDHTSIMYQVRKNEALDWSRSKLEAKVTEKKPKKVYRTVSFPKPKTYKDYLREARYKVNTNLSWGMTFRKLGRDLIAQKLNENSNI